MRVLFLDVDGVLNDNASVGRIDVRLAGNLDEVLRRTGARICLHSSWRYMILGGAMDLRGFGFLLVSHGIDARDRVVGITEPDEEYEEYDDAGEWHDVNQRVWQIRDWLARHPGVVSWAVVDDLPLDFGKDGARFVRTDGAIGLTSDDTARLIEILTKEA